ncbi:MAG: 3-dehydroquinate synthase [Saprospiraceae bacterium]
MAQIHTFSLPEYPVFVGDLAETFPIWLHERQFSRLVVLADAHTRALCLPVFLQKTGLPTDLLIVEIPAGEQHKNLATCAQIWQSFLAEKLDRRALVLNLGGGVVGDMGGFCAATFKRGVAFAQIPTTLLAMTDAAIGGKLGIDFQGVKNIVGVFQNPAAVFCDPDFLPTLPVRELRSGMAEVLKHAAIGDPVLWRQLSKLSDLNAADWSRILPKSIAVKVRVVRRDPLEKNLRQLLNFGHTIGHALESHFLETADPLTHGEAVAIGMICEQFLADPAAAARLADVVLRFFGHRPLPESDLPVLWDLMQQDKKNTAGAVRVALPSDGKLGLQILEPSRASVAESLRFYNALAAAVGKNFRHGA